MKALFLLYWLSRSGGGICPAARSLALALQKQSVEPTVLGLDDPFWQDDAGQWSALYTEALPWSGPRALGWCPALPERLRAIQPDLVHVHGLWMYYSQANARFCRATERPYIISPHGMLEPWALNNSGWKKKLAGLLYEDRHLRDATCLHALSKAEHQSIRDYGLTNPVAIIPNGVDLPSLQEINPEHSPDDGRKRMLFLGRIHPKKGLHPLIDGWAKWLHHDVALAQEWLLEITGWDDGGHLPALIAQARESVGRDQVAILGECPTPQTRIAFTGPRHGLEKQQTYQRASGFILPSFSEGLPLTVLEAWSFQVPVLITPACNLSAGYTQQAALEIQPTADSIAETLHTFAKLSASERADMGRRGRELVEARYTWDLAAKSMLSVYQWMLGSGSKPDCIVE